MIARPRRGPGLLALLALLVLPLTACSSGPPRAETVFMGDSITAGGIFEKGAEPNEFSWVRYALEADDVPWELGANVAVSGETLSDMALRFSADVVAAEPTDVVIMGGTNDVLRDVPRTVSESSLRQMIDAAQAAGIRVWVVAPPPCNLKPSELVALRSGQARIAAEEGVTWLDPTSAVGQSDGQWTAGLTGDGVHPLPDGAAVLGETIARLASEAAALPAPSPSL